ncbi:MAG: phenylalanine--tRNA ligase subunit beta [Endomicrobiia bacterium]|nr:phenylalanine--tRNA ligase subunit beta [Endomicrobiia bacterium]
MLLSYEWLKDFIAIKETPQELSRIITSLGFEATLRPANSGFSGVVVAKVVSKISHPSADKLSVCEVSDGAATYKVVCGAANVAVAQIVPFAKIGAKIQGIEIKKAKLRGVESEGMICSEKELGLADSSEGIMTLAADAEARLGADFSLLYTPDFVIEVEPLPNRPDILSHYGVAQEIAAKLNRPLKIPEVHRDKINPDGRLADIEQAASDDCESYIAVAIDGASVGESPEWLKNRLRLAGYRPINAAVDVTNYVMAELGHPLHVFDRDKLSGGKVVARPAASGEKIKALDGKVYTLAARDLLIADGALAAVAIAGIIGGEGSAVSFSTTKILLESAVFNPRGIFATRRRLKVSTESSYRFERGMNKERSMLACLRAVELLKSVCSGRPVSIFDHGVAPARNKIAVFYDKIRSHSGVSVADAKVRGILTALAFDIVREEHDFIVVEPPSFRRDIVIQEDVIEEIIRVFGYDNASFEAAAPDSHPAGARAAGFAAARRRFDLVAAARRFLAASGFVEHVNYGMISPEWFEYFDEKECVKIINPVSPDAVALRPSLFSQMWRNFTADFGEGLETQMIFETGNVFYGGAQSNSLGILASGNIFGRNWKKGVFVADFFFLKGIVENLLFFAGKDVALEFRAASEVAPRVPARPDFLASRINIMADGVALGCVGPVAPSLALDAGVNAPVWWVELDVAALSLLRERASVYKAYSPFPPSSMDFSCIIPTTASSDAVRENLLRSLGADARTVESVMPTDLWRTPDGETSMTLRVTLRHPSKTLDTAELGALHEKIANALASTPGLKLRA